VLANVAARVHAEDEEGAVFAIALDEILTRLGLEAAWIFTGSAGERLELAAARGVSQEFLDEVRDQGLAPCLCPEVLAGGRRTQARNTTQCPRMPRILSGGGGSAAHACIPLKFEASTVGVLNVAARPGELFTDDELSFLETLGHQIGLAVERGRHRLGERQRDLEARGMAAVGRAVGAAIETTAVLEAVGDSARDLLGADHVLILLGDGGGALRVGYANGSPLRPLREHDEIDPEDASFRDWREALREKRAVRASLPAPAASEPAGQELALPMLARGRALGLLVLSRRSAADWRREQLEVAEAFAAQAALRLDNARLYEDSQRAFTELQTAQDRVVQQEKMAVLGTFASGLAHEVRNPLNSIGLQLTVLERKIARLAPQLAPETSELALTIRDEVRRLDRLVSDFLLFARSGRVLAADGDLDAVVADVVTLLAPEADAAGVRLRWDRAGQPARGLRMDGERMKQVVINLVRNGIEAQPDGGVVVVETGLVEDVARLRVHDAGPGLPEDVDVFQLFVTTKDKGTGLGLSIVQQITRHHGGTVRTGRGPLGGACFTIDLPATAPDQGERL
jgi:signal transduction histidine kinase